MKKYFAKAFLGLCALGTSTVAFAQDAAAPAVETGCRLYEFNRNRIDLRFGIRIGKNYLFELG